MKSAHSVAIGLMVFFPIYLAIDGAAALLMSGASEASKFAQRLFVLTSGFWSPVINIIAAGVAYLAASAAVRRFAGCGNNGHCLKVFVIVTVLISAAVAIYSLIVGVEPTPSLCCGLVVGVAYLMQRNEE